MYGLTKEQAEMFLNTHEKHMKAFGTENQKKYALENVRSVKWDEESKTVNVYYDDIWWHYTKNGEWY